MIIYGIGTDIVSIKRIKSSLKKNLLDKYPLKPGICVATGVLNPSINM